ncbi:MAG: PH domain-containing protein [Verrucomicrobiae bacterium]|nr:PH domain-containing protein [Verrucomicrobiae bacterium]
MTNNGILDFIRFELAQGKSRQEIVASFLRAGWQRSDVEEAFDSLTERDESQKEKLYYSTEEPLPVGRLVTEKDYPITMLWLIKEPLMLLIGGLVFNYSFYYGPHYLIVVPFYFIIKMLAKENFSYSIEAKFFVVKEGIITKKQRSLAYGMIQNILIKQDWFDRIFGLATLCIENASQGGAKRKNRRKNGALRSLSNKVNIPGLRKKDADALKLILIHKIKENPIEDLGL